MLEVKSLRAPYDDESRHWCQHAAGQLIRARKARGWSQKELGERIGISQTAVAKLEREPQSAHIDKMIGALSAVGLSIVVQPASVASMRARTRATDPHTAPLFPQESHGHDTASTV